MKLSRSSKPSLKQSATSMVSKSGRVEVEEITTEVLDQLLAELTNNGCENKLKTDRLKKEETKQPMKETVTEQQLLTSERSVRLFSSFNNFIFFYKPL